MVGLRICWDTNGKNYEYDGTPIVGLGICWDTNVRT